MTVINFRKDSTFVITGSQDCTLKVWTLPEMFSTDSLTRLHTQCTEKAHEKDINAIAIAPNDKFIATGW